MSDKAKDSFLALLNEQDKQDAAEAGLEGHKIKLEEVKPLVQDKILKTSPVLDKTIADVRKEAAEKYPEAEIESASSAFVPMVDPNDVLEYKRPGVQYYVVKKLRMGEYREADFIDLHGKSLEDAYEIVMRFISFAKEQEFRCVLIIHGKGDRQKQKGLIKSYTAHWLRQIPEVLAFHSAPEWKGGTGALMIILKKGEKAKIETRERFSRR